MSMSRGPFYNGMYLPLDPSNTITSADQPVSTDDPRIQTSVGQNHSTVDYEEDENKPRIRVEVTVTHLTDEQKAHFVDYIEWWNKSENTFYTGPAIEGVDAGAVVEALRVSFWGRYVMDEDDFEGRTYYSRSVEESDTPQQFSRRDKHNCGFLYLRNLRTGRRALSLEHGSLLDIILRLKEIRPHMWESTISGLARFDVASDPELGISGVLESINTALKKYVPREWGVEPHLRVSTLTRDHLRNVITAFIATGNGSHSAPFYLQGTGTVNMLVLAMLSLIAEDRQNVIFAMEEPETAIPPYAQKRIVHEIRKLSTQSLFTSHSPYVLEEFDLDETIVVSRSSDGRLTQAHVVLPDSVKHKRYRQEFRTRFCEGLLARRILVAEGADEAASLPVVARCLSESAPTRYTSLETLGICTINAGSDTQIADLGCLYRSLGKTVYGVCDNQSPETEASIRGHVDALFMHSEKGIEDLVVKNTTTTALKRFAKLVTWPEHILQKYPDPSLDVVSAVSAYFRWSKGKWGIADFLSHCTEDEIPEWLRDTCAKLRELVLQESNNPSQEEGESN